MIQEITNPIAIQSREWLTNALLVLMDEKEFKNISITEIAAKADLSRRTFYRIFETKEDIIVYYADKLYGEFLQLLNQESDHRFAVTIRLYFQFWYEHRHFLELLRRNEMLPFIMNQYSRLFPEVFQIIKGNHPLAHNAEALSYAMAFSAGGLLSILYNFFKHRFAFRTFIFYFKATIWIIYMNEKNVHINKANTRANRS